MAPEESACRLFRDLARTQSFEAMATRPAQAPHAIVFPFPAQGHLNPMLQFSRMLAAEGFVVTFVVLEFHRQRIVKAWRHEVGMEAGFGIRLEGISDGLPADHPRNPDAAFMAAVDNLSGAFEELMQKLSRRLPRVSCIVSDSFLPWTQDVANDWDLPRMFFWTQSAAVFACHVHFAQIVAHGFHPFKHTVQVGALKEPMDSISCIPGLPALHPADLPFNIADSPGKRWFCANTDRQFQRLSEATWIACNSFFELEKPVFEALESSYPLRPIGPLLPRALLDGEITDTNAEPGASLWQDDDCMEWLGTHADSSVLFISFGSVAKLSVEDLHEFSLGVAASEQPFLWATRSDEVAGLLPEGFIDSVSPRGKIVNWAPQIRVLGHPAIGGFLSHCGWNSTLESISCGVPILACPLYLDHYLNSWFVVNEWKVGVEIERKATAEVEKAVRLLMQEAAGRELRQRAGSLSIAARRCAASSTAGNVQLFVDGLRRSMMMKRGSSSRQRNQDHHPQTEGDDEACQQAEEPGSSRERG